MKKKSRIIAPQIQNKKDAYVNEAIKDLEDFDNTFLKSDDDTYTLEIEVYKDKKIELEKTVNKIQEFTAKKENPPYSLINQFLRCFPYLPSVKNYPLDYFEQKNLKIDGLINELKIEFADYKIDYNKYVAKRLQKPTYIFTGEVQYGATFHNSQNFIHFLSTQILNSLYESTFSLTKRQKEQFTKDILKHIQTYELFTGKGAEFKQFAFAGYIANTLGLFQQSVTKKEYWIQSDFRKALFDKVAYILRKTTKPKKRLKKKQV
jgi:hypothetical protein